MFRRKAWVLVALGLLLCLGGAVSLQAQGSPENERYFAETGYSVEDDLIWDYFQARGGVDTFGYPVSNLFTYRDFPVQIFQRHVLQVNEQQARPLNLLDPDLMPVTSLNGSTFPAHDPEIAQMAPPAEVAGYGAAVRQHLEATVPEQWAAAAVGFLSYYFAAAPATSGDLRPLVALEVWGFPTSQPTRDPANHDFIYQRFQRGIMHYDKATGATRGILLGDAFKGMIGQDVAFPTVVPPPPVVATPVPAGTPAPLPTATDGRYPKAQESGFVVTVVADSAESPIEHPTSLAWDRSGALYVSRMEGPIIRVAPNGERSTFADGFDVPLGLAFRPGTDVLYVSHRGGVTTLRDANGDGVAEDRQPFLSGLPCCYSDLHQTNGIEFGPDGWLYIVQGSTSDHGEAPGAPWHAGILRVHPDAGQASLEYVATGLRNPYDLVVRADGTIFATDNGADFGPPEELNHILPGADYGWPYCVTDAAGEIAVHPSWADWERCVGTRAAVATFVPHASANGLTAYEADQFPAAYRGDLFVALWSHIADAYRIVRVELAPSGDSFTTTLTPFVTDFELPLDIAVGADGALYVADWGPGRIYKVEYAR
ncbi:MAG: PQQ-dependent sugar dehydrogenase [Ardenticatenaceae bacterium]